MALTEHQNDILNESLDILSRNNRLLVKGSAGVGKTYLVNELIKAILDKNIVYRSKTVYCSAPTNKAVAVLKGKVEQLSNLDFITVHSALKLKRQINYKTGDVTFKPYYSDRYPPLQGVGLLVIDETSMLNSELLDYVEEHADNRNVKVIFIGDHKQLNPVGEEESPVFHRDFPEVELTEIIRQGEGNPIIDLSRNIKDIWKGQENTVNDPMIGYLYSQDKEYIIDKLAEINGSDDLKYLGWTNKDVDALNNKVRERIYGTPKKVEVGESIVFNSPYGETYFTNEELEVKTVDIQTLPFKVIVESSNITKSFTVSDEEIKCYIVNGIKLGEKAWSQDSVIIVHEDSEKEFRILKAQLVANCKNRILEWVDYYNFLEKFADFKYNHALTVHKSQGSTYKKAIVNVGNLNLNKNSTEKQRLFYTAITRASDLLILYNV